MSWLIPQSTAWVRKSSLCPEVKPVPRVILDSWCQPPPGSSLGPHTSLCTLTSLGFLAPNHSPKETDLLSRLENKGAQSPVWIKAVLASLLASGWGLPGLSLLQETFINSWPVLPCGALLPGAFSRQGYRWLALSRALPSDPLCPYLRTAGVNQLLNRMPGTCRGLCMLTGAWALGQAMWFKDILKYYYLVLQFMMTLLSLRIMCLHKYVRFIKQ